MKNPARVITSKKITSNAKRTIMREQNPLKDMFILWMEPKY